MSFRPAAPSRSVPEVATSLADLARQRQIGIEAQSRISMLRSFPHFPSLEDPPKGGRRLVRVFQFDWLAVR